MDNISSCNSNGNLLKEVMVKIELEKIDIQESIIVKALLDSSTMGLVMSLEFAKKKTRI